MCDEQIWLNIIFARSILGRSLSFDQIVPWKVASCGFAYVEARIRPVGRSVCLRISWEGLNLRGEASEIAAELAGPVWLAHYAGIVTC